MKIRYHKTQAIPAAVAADIQRIISSTKIRFPGVHLSNVDVVLVAGWNPFGVLGNTFYKGTIMLVIDTNRPWHDIRSEVFWNYCHEMHHIGRQSTVGFGKSLAEAVVTEGLATSFEVEMGFQGNLHARKLTGTNRVLTLQAFQKERNRKRYDYDRWFFGKGNLPNWAGYRLGAELVADYCERTGAKPSELVATPASVILKNHPLLK